MSMRTAVLLAALAALAAAVGGSVWRVQAAAGDQPGDAPKSTFSVAEAQSFSRFPLYDAGPLALGLRRVAVLRRDDGPADYVSFVYGDCAAQDGTGCAPPAEIQVWPACVRNLSLYREPDTPSGEQAAVRGVPAAFFEEGRRLELQTGRATVVVFARSRGDALELAGLLRGVNVTVGPGQRLPRPTEGSVAGRLECGG
jgi:hypothetical protein